MGVRFRPSGHLWMSYMCVFLHIHHHVSNHVQKCHDSACSCALCSSVKSLNFMCVFRNLLGVCFRTCCRFWMSSACLFLHIHQNSSYYVQESHKSAFSYMMWCSVMSVIFMCFLCNHLRVRFCPSGVFSCPTQLCRLKFIMTNLIMHRISLNHHVTLIHGAQCDDC